MSGVLFIAGTGTDVGKTHVSALIVKFLRDNGISAGYFKPAASGNVRQEDGSLLCGDVDFVLRTSGSDQDPASACPFVYEAAYSPALASRLEGRPFDPDEAREAFLKVCDKYESVVVEGAGGILCPLIFEDDRRLLFSDLVVDWDLPCLLVSDSTLGSINSVGLTAEHLRSRGVRLNGIVFNRYDADSVLCRDNAQTSVALAGAPQIATVAENATQLDADLGTVLELFQSPFVRIF